MTKNRIREIMTIQGITADDLSKKIPSAKSETGFISVSGLNQHITGNPSVKVLQAIADALGVPLWQLFISPEEAARQQTHTTNNNDLCAFVRYKGKHYVADTLGEFYKIVEDIKDEENE